ncbi:TetR/AcrR family transcriptional regulator [Roseinatronobacter alkalisoli]|uniref:TetR/AcrR family transcriptional regulator n=1 Tax=Roseinatronobacter alkalisoli TaxID=3028235 RepID=A0ABT5TC61_9RHOB|nr:TetR/AcrR family transcriptional regulator [Roseinatronobacter sp. HJB301]MDD7972684.1 TetR/AcrR family transcriptional regulator [Roseinatronobacter sp. HJB301]
MTGNANIQPDRPEGGSSRLGREDWIAAAWEALSEGSADTIKVDRLARRIGVTRGSFYWHFRNREDLIDAVVEYWLKRLARNASLVDRHTEGATPEDRLWTVYDFVVRSVTGPQSVFLRIAAQKSPHLTRRLQDESTQRVDADAALFCEMGLPPADAQQFATLYNTMIVSEFLRNGALPLEERLALARSQHDLVINAARRFSPA